MDRLGSTSTDGGRLEVYLFGRWGTVCSNGFDEREAVVACRQLGYFGYARYGLTGELG